MRVNGIFQEDLLTMGGTVNDNFTVKWPKTTEWENKFSAEKNATYELPNYDIQAEISSTTHENAIRTTVNLVLNGKLNICRCYFDMDKTDSISDFLTVLLNGSYLTNAVKALDSIPKPTKADLILASISSDKAVKASFSQLVEECVSAIRRAAKDANVKVTVSR